MNKNCMDHESVGIDRRETITEEQLRGKRSNTYIRTWSQFQIYLTALVDNQLTFTDGVYIVRATL